VSEIMLDGFLKTKERQESEGKRPTDTREVEIICFCTRK